MVDSEEEDSTDESNSDSKEENSTDESNSERENIDTTIMMDGDAPIDEGSNELTIMSESSRETTTIASTTDSISTSSSETFTTNASFIITIASGVGVLVLSLFNVLVICGIFVYRKSKKTEDKNKPNPRHSLSSMIYNSMYNNGSNTNTMETTASCKVSTVEHIYSEVV